MSITRKPTASGQDLNTDPHAKTKIAIIKGIEAGVSISMTRYLVDRFSIIIRVREGARLDVMAEYRKQTIINFTKLMLTDSSPAKAIREIYLSPFKGAVINVCQTTIKLSINFALRQEYVSSLNKYNEAGVYNASLANGLSAACAAYMVAPLSVMKTMRYNGVTVANLFSSDWRHYTKGVHMNTVRDSLFFSAYSVLSPQTNGTTAGILAALISYPAALVGDKQKASTQPTSALAITKKIIAQHGIRGLWHGYTTTAIIPSAIMGFFLKRFAAPADEALQEQKLSHTASLT